MQPERTVPSTLAWVTVEIPAEFSTEERGDYGEVIAMHPDPDRFPADGAADYATALGEVMAEADGAVCGLDECGQAIGWVLYEDDEAPWRGGLSWRWVSLVHTDAGVLAVCEECSPENLYAASVPREGFAPARH